MYTFQCGYKIYTPTLPTTDTNTDNIHGMYILQHFKHVVLALKTELKKLYQQLVLIIMGDFQHTVLQNTLYRMSHQ